MSQKLSHLDDKNQPKMVDVSEKNITSRMAVAQAVLLVPTVVLNAFANDDQSDLISKKGSVFQTANIAGIMAVKNTAQLIPLCHPLPLESIKLSFQLTDSEQVVIKCTVKNSGKTGVEMEALTGATVAALTVYDMCKAVSPAMTIKEVKLLEKTGGKRDYQCL